MVRDCVISSKKNGFFHKKMWASSVSLAAFAGVSAIALPSAGHAANLQSRSEVNATIDRGKIALLEEQLALEKKERALEAKAIRDFHTAALAEQQRQIDALQQQVTTLMALTNATPATSTVAPAAQTPSVPAANVPAQGQASSRQVPDAQMSQANTQQQRQSQQLRQSQAQGAVRQAVAASDQDLETIPQIVGERPSDAVLEPELGLFADIGGILTQPGVFLVEPQLSYTSSSDNRFFYEGTEIADAILIGVINATDTDRNSLNYTQGLRYGLNSRVEVDLGVPFLYRSDTISGVQIDNGTERLRDLDGSGLGDVTAGIHYQINAGHDWPYMIANLRAKAPTGEGPFDVARDDSGLETEAATGSGFWTIEPSLTFLKRVDPAVLFANIGYQINLAEDIKKQVGATFYEEVDPGNAIRTSFGVGLSLNEKLSVNFGYDQSYIFDTQFRVRAFDQDADVFGPVQVLEGQDITIGSFLFGLAYNPGGKIRFNLNTSIGATDEAPDVSLTLKAQRRFGD